MHYINLHSKISPGKSYTPILNKPSRCLNPGGRGLAIRFSISSRQNLFTPLNVHLLFSPKIQRECSVNCRTCMTSACSDTAKASWNIYLRCFAIDHLHSDKACIYRLHLCPLNIDSGVKFDQAILGFLWVPLASRNFFISSNFSR
jgi:hypothetical protein